MSNPLTIKSVSSLQEMTELRPSWNDLLASCVKPNVFASWEWQYLAAGLFAPDQNLRVLLAFHRDELAAILPLRQNSIKVGGLIATAVWRCLGGGLTDYNALLVKEKYLSETLAAFADYIRQSGLPVDFENVLPDSPLDLLGRRLADVGFRPAVYESKNALITELPEDYDRFLQSKTKKFRKTLRNNQNVMDRAEGYTYHFEKPSEELLTVLISLHTSRWHAKGESGALARRQIKDFHSALMGMADKPFEIRYFTIRHESRIIAILYGFVMARRFYAYLSGFDMAHTRISPGNMVINFCLQELLKDGITVFDMLRGDMKYKQTWATVSYDMLDTLYFPPTGSGRRLHFILKTVQAVKRLIPVSLKTSLKSLLRRKEREKAGDD